jgi:hypothetical protein
LDPEVPTVIDYTTVLETLERSGLRCVYPNSGAFGLPPGGETHVIGWCAKDDPTIRAQVRSAIRVVPPPASQSLATMLRRAWQQNPPGPIWLMPASHWAFELQFGAADWLPSLLADHAIDPELLRPRSDGSAIQFQPEEADSFSAMVRSILERLVASDFTVAFPGRPVTAMLHHHQQIWWQTSDREVWDSIGLII